MGQHSWPAPRTAPRTPNPPAALLQTNGELHFFLHNFLAEHPLVVDPGVDADEWLVRGQLKGISAGSTSSKPLSPSLFRHPPTPYTILPMQVELASTPLTRVQV